MKLRTTNEQYNYDVVNDTLAKYRLHVDGMTFEDASCTISIPLVGVRIGLFAVRRPIGRMS